MAVHGGNWAQYKAEYNKMPIDYSANISPLGLPFKIRMAIIKSLKSCDLYPDIYCSELREKLSHCYGIDKDFISCGNGAADIIFKICAGIAPKTALILAPTFAEYKKALTEAGAQVKEYLLKEDNNFLLTEDFLNSIDENTDIIFLCQPNNPTGALTSKELLIKIICKAKRCGAIVVLDECFTDFTDDEYENSLISDIESFDNLIILKAFTKMYAMAGIRLGYFICSNTELREKISSLGQPWSVSTVAQAAGIAALSCGGYKNKVRLTIKKERDFLLKSFDKLPLKYFMPSANFILFKCDIENLGKEFEKRGFVIRDCSNYSGLSKGYYRIAVKKHSDNKKFIKAFNDIVSVKGGESIG